MSPLPDGVYFDLPEAEYHAQPRLGSSAIGDLLISPATFWARSWLNPDREEEETDAQRLGRAYHLARLQPERFHEVYARGFDPDQFPDALRTDSEVKGALAEMGEAKTKSGEVAFDRALRLVAAGFDGGVLSLCRLQHEEACDGREPLAPATFDQIEASIALMRRDPDIEALITGGEPEVSIFWTVGDVPCKARIDYLRPDGWADLKTFSNPNRKQIDRCVADAFRYGRYYIQAAWYDIALEAVRTGKVMDAVGRPLTNAIREAERPLPCHYIFAQTDGSANILAREIRLRIGKPGVDEQSAGAEENMAEFMTMPSRLLLRARDDIDFALRQFRWAGEVWGPREPWGPRASMGVIGDDDFPDRWLDGEWT